MFIQRLKKQTHIDVESGSSINLPGAGYYPPVNDKIKGFKVFGKTTGGEGTPAVPVPLIETPYGFNIFSGGASIFNATNILYNWQCTVTEKTVSSFKLTKTETTLAYGLFTLGNLPQNTTVGLSFNNADMNVGQVRAYQQTATGSQLSPTIYGTLIFNETTSNITSYKKIFNTGTGAYSNILILVYSETTAPAGTTTTVTNISAHIGTKYPIRLEDTDGVLHSGNSLPDGTADSYDRDNALFTQRVKVNTFPNGTGWAYTTYSPDTTVALVFYNDTANAWGSALGNSVNLRCTIGKASLSYTAKSVVINKRINDTQIVFTVLKTDLGVVGGETQAQLDILAQNWITAHCPFIIMYQLATPLTFPIKPYNVSTFAYNQIPMSVQYTNNIFTDAVTQPTLQCEIRKLGNRAITENQLIT
jgi:hypothetical protein